MFLSNFFFFEYFGYFFSSIHNSSYSFNYYNIVNFIVFLSLFFIYRSIGGGHIGSLETLLASIFFLNCLYYYLLLNNLVIIFFLFEFQIGCFIFLISTSLNNFSSIATNYFNLLIYQYWFSLFSSLILYYSILLILQKLIFTSWLEIVMNLLFLKSLLIIAPLFFGFVIKLGLFPFFVWKPELYKGLNILLFFLYTFSYTFCFIFFLVFLFFKFYAIIDYFYLLYIFLALFSILILSFYIWGILEVRSFIAYTSLLHTSFIFFILFFNLYGSIDLVVFYLITYFITVFSFFILLLLSNNLIWFFSDLHYLNSYRYLFFYFIILLLGFSGFPPFLGFFSKMSVLISCLLANDYWLFFILLVPSFFIAFFYLYNYRFFGHNNEYLNYKFYHILDINGLALLNFLIFINIFGFLFLGEFFLLGSFIFKP